MDLFPLIKFLADERQELLLANLSKQEMHWKGFW